MFSLCHTRCSCLSSLLLCPSVPPARCVTGVQFLPYWVFVFLVVLCCSGSSLPFSFAVMPWCSNSQVCNYGVQFLPYWAFLVFVVLVLLCLFPLPSCPGVPPARCVTMVFSLCHTGCSWSLSLTLFSSVLPTRQWWVCYMTQYQVFVTHLWLHKKLAGLTPSLWLTDHVRVVTGVLRELILLLGVWG